MNQTIHRILWKYTSICFNSSFSLARSRDVKVPTCFSVVFFLRTCPKGEHANLVYSTICFLSKSNISSPARYSYLSIFPDHNTDIFATSLLISYCKFSSLILSSIVTISFYILYKRFFVKCII